MSSLSHRLRFCELVAAAVLLQAGGMFGAIRLQAAEGSRQPNVLFICIDDLRPELGCYGATQMHTPHIDRLASQGVVFDRAYCMVPVCGASRASMMTGLRPTPARFTNAATWAEKDAPDAPTLNMHFQGQGYRTLSNGKIFHNIEDRNEGWSSPAWRPTNVATYQLEQNQQVLRAQRTADRAVRRQGPPWESADVADNAYADGQVLEKSIADLQQLAKKDQPFFLAVGFLKPHLPFVAPKKYWDLYDRKSLKLPATYHPPQDVPQAALHNWAELRGYAGVPARGPVTDDMAIHLIHGYYACVSYADALVGQLLDELTRLGMADNTVVVLWGDHGWQLGEHTLWCKHSLFETSMHAPLIVAAPGIAGGKHSPALVEFIDIYPTLCDLAGLPAPDHLDGKSFRPLLEEPDQPWKTAAVGRFRNGETIRTDTHRFTEYAGRRPGSSGQMLYDHRTDPQEDSNLAARPENGELVQELAGRIEKATRATLGEE